MKKSHLSKTAVAAFAALMITACSGTKDEPTKEADTTASVTTTAAPATEAVATTAAPTEAPTTLAPTTEAPTTQAPTTAEPTTEVPVQKWWEDKGYLGQFTIDDDHSVVLEAVKTEDDFGYFVYDVDTQERIGTLSAPGRVDWFFEKEIKNIDSNDDGYLDIVIPVNETLTLCYKYVDDIVFPQTYEGCYMLVDQNGASMCLDLGYIPYEDRKHPNMTEREKEFYDDMLQKVKNYEEFSYLVKDYEDGDAMDEVLRAWGYLRTDYPEIDCYFKIVEQDDENGDVLGMASEYRSYWADEPSDSIELIRDNMEMFEDEADRIVAELTEDMTAYQKYMYLAKTISINANYEYDFAEKNSANEAPYSGIMGGKFVCEGYSKAFKYLCRKANLYCDTVTGVAGDSEGHMWNVVKQPDGTYYVDVTWCDTLAIDPEAPEWMSYFMLTEEQISVDHKFVAEEQ
ncbi:MAG: hypothetical protein IKX10_08490 [Lachnospiraceae bacterium]|nr:hypothetical protein [Lachnospiraceae bacterium]